MPKKRTILTCLGVVVLVMLVVLGLIVALALYLAFMPQQRYTDDDATATLAAGTERIETWLAQQESEATLIETENVIFSYPSGPSYLTDYVKGSVVLDGVGRSVVINTVDGAVYLDDIARSLDAALPAYLAQLLALPRYTEFVTVSGSLLVPFAVEGSTHEGPRDVLDLGPMLPVDVVDAGSWLQDPSRRCKVSIDLYAHPGDDFDLSALTFSQLNDIREREGLAFNSLYLTNEAQSLDAMHDHYFYEHYAEGQAGPFVVWYRDGYLEQELDRSGAITEVGSAHIDLDRDLTIGASGQDWVLRTSDEAGSFPFFLYAPSGSELLDRTYRWVQETTEEDLMWKAREDGTFCLSTTEGIPFRFYGSGVLSASQG